MKPTFEKTVDILVQAYFDGELQHGDCRKCVVGNLCGGSPLWEFLFVTEAKNKIQSKREVTRIREMFYGKTKEEIILEATDVCLSTGYTVDELKRIEFAFETADGYIDFNPYTDEDDPNDFNDEWMFNGLMAVVDVLAEIHSIDLTTRDEAKLLFAKPQPL